VRVTLPKIPGLLKSPLGLFDFRKWESRMAEWESILADGPVRTPKLPVLLISAAVILLVFLLDLWQVPALWKLELMSYDARVKFASLHPLAGQVNATNLGLVDINDATIDVVNNSDVLAFKYGLYWPRVVYARALRELEDEGVKAVGFDVLFSGRRPNDPPVTNADGTLAVSDIVFAQELFSGGNVILGADLGVLPARLFRNNALDLGNIYSPRDADGVMRRDLPYEDYRVWHPFITQVADQFDLNLDSTQITPTNLTFMGKHSALHPIVFHTDSDGMIATTDITSNVPPGVPDRFLPFAYRRVWSMGIRLAAAELKLDLTNAVIEPENHRIILHGENGLARIIPLQADGTFYINWEIDINHPALHRAPLEELLFLGHDRAAGKTITNYWTNELVMIGSTATGNDISDLGASPLGGQTHLVTKHLNVANAIIANRFPVTSPMALRFLLIALMGILAAWFTSSVARPLSGTALMLAVILLYAGTAFWLYVEYRFWLPIILPLGCSAMVTHLGLLTYRVRAEQAERKRVKSVFSKMLAPEVVEELLSGKVAMGGERRDLTVFFADVRGFTSLTDLTQSRAAEYVQKHQLSPNDAKAFHDRLANETLDTVSTYLGTIAAVIKKHNGTLDKYIGDCVMAFWGGPVGNPRHASDAVKAAIDAQRAILALNFQRDAENKVIAAQNEEAAKQGLPPHSLKPLLALGTGINSGPAIMGLMGSNEHGLNYTVFGREVNLASRLEGLSGHSRIIISEGTYQELLRDEPALAELCIERMPEDVKGFRHAVKNYEVQWRPADAPADPEALKAYSVGVGAETGIFAR
jgi:class 3 adenylate cyclase/CHASE2 domain-containing sensor protein